MAIETPLCNFGEKPHAFTLPGVDGKTYGLADALGEKGSLIMFICNHCPYVKAVIGRIVVDVAELKKLGFGVIAINSNDPITYPEDSFDNMKIFAEQHHFNFPYLFDATQQVAQQYGAVCTPDFFGYNAMGELQYRGRLDASRKEAAPNARRDLLEAFRQIAATGQGPLEQFASMGCGIKWRAQAA
jgi:peroxiredoxin